MATMFEKISPAVWETVQPLGTFLCHLLCLDSRTFYVVHQYAIITTVCGAQIFMIKLYWFHSEESHCWSSLQNSTNIHVSLIGAMWVRNSLLLHLHSRVHLWTSQAFVSFLFFIVPGWEEPSEMPIWLFDPGHEDAERTRKTEEERGREKVLCACVCVCVHF